MRTVANAGDRRAGLGCDRDRRGDSWCTVLGTLGIGRLAIGRARIRRLEIDELIVRGVNKRSGGEDQRSICYSSFVGDIADHCH